MNQILNLAGALGLDVILKHGRGFNDLSPERRFLLEILEVLLRFVHSLNFQFLDLTIIIVALLDHEFNEDLTRIVKKRAALLSDFQFGTWRRFPRLNPESNGIENAVDRFRQRAEFKGFVVFVEVSPSEHKHFRVLSRFFVFTLGDFLLNVLL